MPKRSPTAPMSPDERCSEIALILAHGVVRWRKLARNGGFLDASESSHSHQNSLELTGETRLSVSDDTPGLCLRDNGDDA